MTALARIGVACAFALGIAGCALQSSMVPNAVVTSSHEKRIAAERVTDSVVIGKSTKADVVRALGDTVVITFDSGYEVWFYRLGNSGSAEFVILFAPSGIAVKTRIRPEPQRT